MGVKQMLFREAGSVTDKPAKFPFEFKNVPDGKDVGDHIVIHPPTVSTWFRLKPILALIDKKDFDQLIATKGKGLDSDLMEIMTKYDELIFEIVCIGIQNDNGDRPDWFKKVLKDSSTWEDIYILLNAILFRLGATSFSNSIIALKAVSPLDEREIIALQKNKDSWKSKVLSPF